MLAALLLPVLGKAKVKAQQTSCLSNLRQLGFAWIMYYGDNQGYLAESYPGSPQVWVKGDMRNAGEAVDLELLKAGKLYPYHRNPSVYRCPSDKGVVVDNVKLASVRSYSMNSFMGARAPGIGPIPPSATQFVPFFSRDSDLRSATSGLWVLIDEDERSIGDGFFVTDPNARIWYNFPTISSYRHNFAYTISFADSHAEVWALSDPRTRDVAGHEAEQEGNKDLQRLARVTTLPK